MDKAETDAIQRVLAGDRDAYRLLMDRHFCSVHRIAFRITGNQEDAEEAAQEAFLRGYNKLPGFRREAAFSTWITRIAMNTALNLVERRNRDLAKEGLRNGDLDCPRSNGATIPLADPGASPERLLIEREAVNAREAAMNALTPMERTAFTLRHMEDVPIAEIATALNLSTNAAKQAIFRAVAKLRRSLAPLARGQA